MATDSATIEPLNQTHPSTTPPKLPELELLEKIGSGGYGEVWLCRNALGALRAVKIVRRAEFDDDRPYEREFKGIQNFEPISRTHEAFVHLLQVGRNNNEGYFYYVMELADEIPKVGPAVPSGPRAQKELPNSPPTSNVPFVPPPLTTHNSPLPTSYTPRTLASETKTRAPLPIPEILQIATTLTQALATLHSHNLVHRDIKPSNIIFVNGKPKLADIGLVSSPTESRSYVGTEGFIPPEGPGTEQADLYSLGIVLYVLATGKHHRDFPEPPANLSTLPAPDRQQFQELTAIIHKATQTKPRDRYPSAAALLADLQRLQSGYSIKRRHSFQRFAIVTGKILIVALIGGLFYSVFFLSKSANPTNPRPTWQTDGAVSEAAWQTRMRATQMINPYTVSSMSNAVMEFERALELDPNYGIVWGVLAMAHVLAVDFGYVPATNFLPLARLQAQKAIDHNAPYGYMPLALAKLGMDFDFESIEPMFRKAFELDPTDWALRSNFSRHLVYSGRFNEAEQMINQILLQHPERAGMYGVTLAWLYGATDRIPQAIAALDTAIRLDPARPCVYLLRGEFRLSTNERAVGMRDLLRTVELQGFASLDPVMDGAVLRKILEVEGPEEFLRRHIQLLEERKRAGHWVYAFDLARLHAHAGNRASALDFLELALEERGGILRSSKVIPAFKDLRQEPRFHAVLRRLNLEK